METTYWRNNFKVKDGTQIYLPNSTSYTISFVDENYLPEIKNEKLNKMTEYSVILKKSLKANYSKTIQLTINTIIALWSTEVKD